MAKKSILEQTAQNLIICRCESVRLEEILASIRCSDVQSINQIKKLTRAGMGLCQGRTCARSIDAILAAEKSWSSGKEPFRSRPPVRGLSIGALASGSDQFNEPTEPVSVVMSRTSDEKPPIQPEIEDKSQLK
jgi:2Fe-2S iron-sulfur cluster protein